MELSELKPDPKNANRGTERGRYMVEHSLRTYGAGRSILVDKDGNVIAGNKTLEAAADIGLPVKVIDTEGDELVVVRRKDLDLKNGGKARELAYIDNRSSQVGLDWDIEQIASDLAEGVNFDDMFFEDELKETLGDLWLDDEPPEDPGAEIDKAEELRQKWGVESGQLWQLGGHRLICGDCTDAAVVDRVMGGERAGAVVTDPPYGLGDSKSFNIDHEDYEDGETFDLSLLDLSDNYIVFGGQYYEWLPMPRVDLGWVVWDKRPDLEGEKRKRADRRFGQHFELAFTNIVDLRGKIYRQRWGGYYGSQEIWHKTQKPPELFEWCINATDGIVIDYFLGSGTAIIACERLTRKCRAVEISPAYCAVAIERWHQMTGEMPEIID